MIDVKSFLEIHFSRIWKINLLLREKKLLCIRPLPWTAKLGKYYGVYLLLTKEMPKK